MAVRYLDGVRLRRSATAAARWVSQRQENLNGINVFPVPDGDTGTNLAATLVSAVEHSRRVRGRDVGSVSRALAEGALFGACGNSGAILAQYFEGFASALEECDRATGPVLATAVVHGSESARTALARPCEGTILSVMRVWAERFSEQVSSDGADLLEGFRDSLDAAREALARTPEQLRELARAGVVDAGAQGFVYFLEGILHFAEGRLAGSVIEEGDHADPLEHAYVENAPGEITRAFCTECLIEGEGLEIVLLRKAFEPLGDSLVVAGSPRRIRIHVHTNEPDRVFEVAARHGRVSRTKADDMRVQHAGRFDRGRVAVVTDTAADLPDRDRQRLRVHVVPLRVFVGGSAYLDKQTLEPDEVYERLRRGETSVGTSQPPPGDYVALYRYLFEHYGHVVVVSLSGALSGTIAAARTAASAVDAGRVSVLDGGTASIAQGLIVRAAAERARAGGSVEEVVAAAEDARGRVRLLLGAPTLEYFLRGGRIRGWKARLGEWLGVVPILGVPTEKGTPKIVGIARRGRVHRTLLGRAVRDLSREDRPPARVWIAHAGADEVADAFRERISETVSGGEVEVLEVGPVLGAHAGPGAIAIAWLAPASDEDSRYDSGREERLDREEGG